MFNIYLKWQYSALGVCPLSCSDPFPLIGNVHCFCSSNEAIGSDPMLCVICISVLCSMQTRNKGRSFGEPAYGKGMLNLPGRMLIVVVICGVVSCLLGARSKSWTSCQTAVENHHLAIRLDNIGLDMTWAENLKWTICLSLSSFHEIVLNFFRYCS